MKFGQAFNKHDASALAALFTQDAVQLWSWTSEDAVASGQQAIEKRYAVMLSSSPGEFVGQVVEVYPIGNEMSVITKDSEGTLWKGYKVRICVRDADTWKIRMEYVNCSELRTSATQTDNIRGFETKLSENEGPLKTAFAENQTTLIENRPITSGRDHITENGK